jgi:hypothetical protein
MTKKRLSRICVVVNYTHNLRSNFLFFCAENQGKALKKCKFLYH